MWVYEQSSGWLYDATGAKVWRGYAGQGDGKNNPAMQTVPNKGPIPVGLYTIDEPIDTKTHGDYVMWLTPDADNEMHGRSAFGIHGDSRTHPGWASEGCIIQPRDVRERIWTSGDHRLQVVAVVATV